MGVSRSRTLTPVSFILHNRLWRICQLYSAQQALAHLSALFCTTGSDTFVSFILHNRLWHICQLYSAKRIWSRILSFCVNFLKTKKQPIVKGGLGRGGGWSTTHHSNINKYFDSETKITVSILKTKDLNLHKAQKTFSLTGQYALFLKGPYVCLILSHWGSGFLNEAVCFIFSEVVIFIKNK